MVATAVQATLASLLVSQLLGAFGDTVGSRLCRVVYGGSPARMMIATSIIGMVLTMSCIATLHFSDVAEVRFGAIMLAPDLWIANGVLAATYNTGEAYLLLYSFGAVIKSITPLAAPLVLWFAEGRGLFGPVPVPESTSGPQLLNFAVGTVGAILLVSLAWGKHRSSVKGKVPSAEAPAATGNLPTAKVVGASTVVPATVTLILCNTGWNALQRVSFTKHNLNRYEWVFLDKVIGGLFALVFLAARAFKSGQHMEWSEALQETVASPSAVFAASGYVLLQLLRIALVFSIVGTGSSGVSTGTFLVTVVRVLLATSVNLLVTRFAPAFLNLQKEDAEHLMAPKPLLKAAAGGALISISVVIWYMRASTALTTAVHARSEPPMLLAIGDWGVVQGEDAGVVPLAMAKFTGSDSAVVLNLGDSFYPDGVTNDVEFLSRETAYASMFGEHLAAQQWHSVLGNHDYRGNATLVSTHGAQSWLGYVHTGGKIVRGFSTWFEARFDTIFVALDTNFLQKDVICTRLGKQRSDTVTQACLQSMYDLQTTQTEWLETVLADAQKRNVSWCIVFGHHPIFASGKWAFYEADKTAAAVLFAPLFEKYGVSLYISGHDHVQQLYERGGVYYAISGAGGAELDDAPFEDLQGIVENNATLHLADANHGFTAMHFDLSAGLLCIHFLGVQPSKNMCRTVQECRQLCKLGVLSCHCLPSRGANVQNGSVAEGVSEDLDVLVKLHGQVDDGPLQRAIQALAKLNSPSSPPTSSLLATVPTAISTSSASTDEPIPSDHNSGLSVFGSRNQAKDHGSPDPWCQLRLSELKTARAAWMLKLPVIDSDQFEASPWRDYVDYLYGPLQPEDFPVDLRCLEFWWAHHIPRELYQTFFEGRTDLVDVSGKRTDVGAQHIFKVNLYGTLGEHTLRMQQDHSPDHNRHHHFPVLAKRTFESNTRIEVYHDGTDCTNRDDFIGYWVFFAPGSGIWINLGKTATFSTYFDACKHFVGTNNPVCKKCCAANHRVLMPAARAAGYDTLQFVDPHSGGKTDVTFEIVLLATPCDASGEIARASNLTATLSMDLMTIDQGVCPPHGLLTRGRNFPRQCVCDVSSTTVNCVGGDTGGIGWHESHVAEPTNLSVGSPCIKGGHRVRC